MGQEAKTILLFHIISARPSKHPRMVGSMLGVYSFGLIFVSARTKKRHHHLLLDESVIARNVYLELVFARNRCAACSHSDLGGCTYSNADALPAWPTSRLCCWQARASVWIATSFRPHPRIHKHENACWSLPLHALCAPHSQPTHSRPVYVQETPDLY